MTAVPPPTDLAAWLTELEAAHAAGTADGPWRAVDNGDRFADPSYRYEILDDEGSVAVCSDDNDATATTGAQRTALIVAAVNAIGPLVAAVREFAELADSYPLGTNVPVYRLHRVLAALTPERTTP